MKALVARLAPALQLVVQEVDISGDDELEARYGLEVPVLVIDGTKAAKYRVSEEELRRIVRGRAGRSADRD
jgi:hypothetical protein